MIQLSKEWIAVIREEINSMAKNNVWELVDLSTRHKTIKNKCVLKIKCKVDISIDKYKVRFIMKGHTQNEGINYKETLS